MEKLQGDPEYLEICRVVEEAHFRRGELVEAQEFEEQYLSLAEQNDRPSDVIESRLRLGYLLEASGNPDEACRVLLGAGPVAKSTGSRLLEARIDERLGYVYARFERWKEARRSFQRALEVHSEIGDPLNTIRVYGALGMLALCTGQPQAGAASLDRKSVV